MAVSCGGGYCETAAYAVLPGTIAPGGGWSSWDFRLQRKMKPSTIKPTAAIPPTTPPAMAPAEDGDDVGAGAGVWDGVGVVVGVVGEVDLVERLDDDDEEEEGFVIACGGRYDRE